MRRILACLLALLLVVMAFAAVGVVRAHAPPITGAPMGAFETILSAQIATDTETALPVLDLWLLLGGVVTGAVFSLWYVSKHYNLDIGRPARNAVILLLNRIARFCTAQGIFTWRGWSLPLQTDSFAA